MKKSRNKISKLGIIAGGGDLPKMLFDKCKTVGLAYQVAGVSGAYKGRGDKYNLGDLSGILRRFKREGVSHIVIIGSVKRPDKIKVKLNWINFRILSRLLFSKVKGDNALLSSIKKEIEKRGFVVEPFHKIVPEILSTKKCYTKIKPSKKDEATIKLGFKEAKKLGAADLGQAVVVADKKLVMVEGKDGTANLIKKVGKMKFKSGVKPILVKVKKDHQDEALDMPTIGIDTVKQVSQAGFKGIIIEAKNTYVVDAVAVKKDADKNKIFISAI